MMHCGPTGLHIKLIGMSRDRIFFGKPCHLPFELEYKTMWAITKLNFELKTAKEERLLQLNELEG